MAARGRERCIALCLAACVLWTSAALAPATGMESAKPPPSLHLFLGIDGTSRSLFGHQGFVWAPRGHLHETGPRLRGLANGGAYTYQTMGFDVFGQALAGEIMPGYQWLTSGYGVTAYLGASVEDHRTQPHDPGKPRQGTRGGAVGMVEGWLRLSDTVVVDASASYATALESYSARIAMRLEIPDGPVLEPEVAVFGEPGYDQLRVGLFAELHGSPTLRVLAGAGWAFDGDGDGPYAGVRVKRWR